jgi:predicted dehydrogenase
MLLPDKNIAICIVGAGGIVNDAHLPAYQIAGFKVAGIYDMQFDKATALAEKFSIPKVYLTLAEMTADNHTAIYDIAVPASEIISVLEQLPDGVSVLIQKPMGTNYQEALEIVACTKRKNLNAGMNFQLRYAPFIQAARTIVENGDIGELYDIEVHVNVFTPWHLWTFLHGKPRIEILYHSIHYIDLVRSFLGDPEGMYAKTVKHPTMQGLSSVRTNMIMDYGDSVRANILTNHCHQYGFHNQQSYIKFEGTKGAIKINMGVLIDYPRGVPDKFEWVVIEEGKIPEWKELEVEGGWFPHAFIGTMKEVMLCAEGKISVPNNHVADALKTMACVEAAYLSSEKGAIKITDIN